MVTTVLDEELTRLTEEEDRTWTAFQVPQNAYENALAQGDIDTMLLAAVKMGKAAERALAAHDAARKQREKVIAFLDRAGH